MKTARVSENGIVKEKRVAYLLRRLVGIGKYHQPCGVWWVGTSLLM